MSGLVYDEVRALTMTFMNSILRHVMVFTQSSGRSTIFVEDLTLALDGLGISLAAGLNKGVSSGRTQSLQSCNARGKRGAAAAEEPAAEAVAAEKTKKAHRFRPGTVALSQINKQQKKSDCLAIPKAPFERLCREVVQDYSDTYTRFQDGVCELLQLVIEDHLVRLLHSANFLAVEVAKRQSLHAADLQAVRQIIGDHAANLTI